MAGHWLRPFPKKIDLAAAILRVASTSAVSVGSTLEGASAGTCNFSGGVLVSGFRLFIARTPLGSLVFRWELSNRMIALRPNAKALRREGLNGPNNLRFIYNQRKRPNESVQPRLDIRPSLWSSTRR